MMRLALLVVTLLTGGEAAAKEIIVSRVTVKAPPRFPPERNYGYAIKRRPTRTITSRFVFSVEAPALRAREWVFVAALPPDTPGQAVQRVRTVPEAETVADLNGPHRELLRAKVPADSDALRTAATFRVYTKAQLFSRELVRGSATGDAVDDLSDRELAIALIPTPRFDYLNPEFVRWRDGNGLAVGPEEGEIDYARRVFRHLVENYRYDYAERMDRRASYVCLAGAADCGGLAALFNATLRSQGVPARSLIGRWAKSEEPGAEVNGVPFRQQHAVSEFFAQGVGWVPVDVSSAILHDRTPQRLRYFGRDRGNFLAMHIDTHLRYDSVHFGPKTTETLQGVRYWVTGGGSLDGRRIDQSWVVRQGR